MTNYRRNFTQGGSYFFTVALADRRSSLLVDAIDSIRQAVAKVKSNHPFHINAWVVMPDHMHAIWTLPDGDCDYPLRWRLIKNYFSRAIPHVEDRSASRASKAERGIWQRRYWEHTIRDEADYQRCFDYIHYNPVKHDHVRCVANWPHSSFHYCVEKGIYPVDWTGLGWCGCGRWIW